MRQVLRPKLLALAALPLFLSACGGGPGGVAPTNVRAITEGSKGTFTPVGPVSETSRAEEAQRCGSDYGPDKDLKSGMEFVQIVNAGGPGGERQMQTTTLYTNVTSQTVTAQVTFSLRLNGDGNALSGQLQRVCSPKTNSPYGREWSCETSGSDTASVSEILKGQEDCDVSGYQGSQEIEGLFTLASGTVVPAIRSVETSSGPYVCRKTVDGRSVTTRSGSRGAREVIRIRAPRLVSSELGSCRGANVYYQERLTTEDGRTLETSRAEFLGAPKR